ncbi:hypothetical protein R1flu_002682 [Riccia fluitans]|uniref:Uncharacterized protein n=1 Tax=Riccia fluitans TaxID=41844 RepID=A0ABD1Y9S7_9MARC
MKQMEEDYTKKLIASSKQLAQATQEISTLKRNLQLAQAASNEKMVEMTVLKLEAKRAEEDRKQLNEALAALKQVSNAGKSTQFRTNSKRNGKDENLDHEGSVRNKRSPFELTAQIKMLQAELKASLEGGHLSSSKDRQEVFSPDDLATWGRSLLPYLHGKCSLVFLACVLYSSDHADEQQLLYLSLFGSFP